MKLQDQDTLLVILMLTLHCSKNNLVIIGGVCWVTYQSLLFLQILMYCSTYCSLTVTPVTSCAHSRDNLALCHAPQLYAWCIADSHDAVPQMSPRMSPVTCRLYWIRPHGPFAWRKACVRITATKRDCSSVRFIRMFFLLPCSRPLAFTFVLCPFSHCLIGSPLSSTALTPLWVWSFRVWSLITFMHDQHRHYCCAFVCRLVKRGVPRS